MFNPYERTEEKLISSWRSITPGMTNAEVSEVLGAPDYEFGVGESWPLWASDSIPESLASTHSLRVYNISGWGPHLLLILFTSDDRVAFAGSAST
jgi:hypothetical protein